MTGKVCVVTGANSGIGKATALQLARAGATVVMVSRDQRRGEIARREIQAHSGNSAVHLLQADLSSQQSIRQLARALEERYKQLDVLINNAGGVYATRRETVNGMEMTLAVNYLAPFLLTNLLLDTIKKSAPARIVNVGSSAHESGTLRLGNLQSKRRYWVMQAYGQAKVAVVMFTYALARRLDGTEVTANCLHPGFVGTNLAQRDLPPPLSWAVHWYMAHTGVSPEEGAKTSVYLATSPEVEGVTGQYFVNCRPVPSAPQTYDTVLQEQLWEASARLTGL